MASVTQLGYVGLSVSNVEEWEHFATEVLGLQSNGIDSDGNLSLRMDEYSQRFIIQPTGKTIDALNKLSLPAGVDIKIKATAASS